MTYLAIKAALSGVLVMIISEVARRNPGFGGLIASLPLVSLLGILWLWRDTAAQYAAPTISRDCSRVAADMRTDDYGRRPLHYISVRDGDRALDAGDW